MKVLEELQYLKTHQWIRREGAQALVGVTDYAQAKLRAVVFVDLPDPGTRIVAGEPFAQVESVKVVSDVYSPVTGVISEVNEALLDEPQRINEAPYEAWMVRVKDIEGTAQLLTAAEYRAEVEALGQ